MKNIDDDLDYGAIDVLVSQAPDLETFSQIEVWDGKAKTAVHKIDSVFEKISHERENLKTKFDASKQIHKKLTFLKRIFSKDRFSAKLKKEMLALDTLSNKLASLKQNLEKLIDATPDDEDEAKVMIKELKLLKKEFAFEKTIVRNQVRNINQNARAQNSAISNQVFFSNAKIRRIQKMSVREQKENSLKPREQQIRALDLQILDIDKKIHHIERIILMSSKGE